MLVHETSKTSTTARLPRPFMLSWYLIDGVTVNQAGSDSPPPVQLAGRVEKPAGRPGMGVPVVGDAPSVAIDPITVLAVPLRRNSFKVSEQLGLLVGVREAVGTPDDHGRRADHAVRNPALLVLEVPGGDPLRPAQQAALVTR